MTTYAERESRRQTWQEAHPTSTPTPTKREPLDLPEGIVPPAENNETWKLKDWLILVAIVVLAPLWLPAWGIYLIWDWWDLRRRPGKTCLTYRMTEEQLEYFEAHLAREREEKAQISG